MMGELTLPERAALIAAQRGWAPQGALEVAVEAIIANRFDQWEWGYGERVRRLESELEQAQASLKAARSALAAVREVRAAQVDR